MSTTSATICAAADALKGLVGYHLKQQQYIVRFSEDAFGLDVDASSIQTCSEFVWLPLQGDLMTLSRQRLGTLLALHLDEQLNLGDPLRLYLRRHDLPEIIAQRQRR